MKRILWLLVLLILLSCGMKSAPAKDDFYYEAKKAETLYPYTFSVSAPDAKTVEVVGEFSDWRRSHYVMAKDRQGTWSRTILLTQGKWQYQFVIDKKMCLDPANPNKIEMIDGSVNSFIVTGKYEDLTIDRKLNSHGSIQKVKIPSEYFEGPSCNVYLPLDYENSNQKYPCLFLLHGRTMNEDQWVYDGRIQYVMDNLIAEKRIKPFIIVMPHGDPYMFYTGNTEGHIINEVIPFIKSNFRVGETRDQFGISGVSMGGFGAYYLINAHPDLFSLSIPLSGYFLGFKEYMSKECYMKKGFGLDFDLYIFCGNIDQDCFDTNEQFVQLLKDNGIRYTYKVSFGGHNWQYWHNIIGDVLSIASDHFYKSNTKPVSRLTWNLLSEED